jgi:predicted nucleotidyltransferase component of viral defense system
MGADVYIGVHKKRRKMNSFSALNFVEAVEMWEFLAKPLTAYREGKAPDLLDMVHTLESKKAELTRLIENGASRFSVARQAWQVIDENIVFPSLNQEMIQKTMSQACLSFPALFALREMHLNKADLDSAVVLASLTIGSR